MSNFELLAALAVAGCGFRVPSATVAGDGREVGGDDDAARCTADCPLGCDATNTRCLELVPSNSIDPAWLGTGSVAFAPTQPAVIDTDAGTVVIGGSLLAGVSYHQMPAVACGASWTVGIGVFSFTSIDIPTDIRVRVVGSRALALLASQPITLEGLLDLGGGAPECADPVCAGPGGFSGGEAVPTESGGGGPGGGGLGYSAGGPGDEAGGGGGAGCGAGGRGGDAGAIYPAGAGGGAFGSAGIVPLCGGSGGGAGGPASYAEDPGARGGGGGGAVQIVSASAVTLSSTNGAPSGVLAGGGGGQGDHAQTYDDGAGGGGAGGAILVEAPVIAIGPNAVLAANGGGGGGGYNNGAIQTEGERGQLAANPAAGGIAAVRAGGDGGAGAVASGSAAPGPIGDGGAGGGGGVGWIRLNSRAGVATVAGVISPSGACSSQGTVATR